MRSRTFVCSLYLLIAARISALTVAEIYVSGIAAGEQAYVRSILPIAVGDVFASVAELERRATLAGSYLEQDRSLANVSIEIEEMSDSEAAVYVLLQSTAIGSYPVFGAEMTVIPHFPVYAAGFGFSIGVSEQLIGLDIPLARRLGVDILLGHSQTVDGTHAGSAKAGLNCRPLPFLSFYLPAEADVYPTSAGRWPVDIAVGAGGRIDFSFLEAAYLFGGSLDVSARRGLAGSGYTGIQTAAALSFRPFSFLSIVSAASLYALFGTAAPLHTVDATGRKSLRVAPAGAIVGNGVASVSVLGRIIVPLSLSLGFMSIAPSAYGFYEAWRPYDAVLELTHAPYASSAGGGVMLELSPPVSLTFEIGYGYSISEGRSAFLFNVK